MARCRFPLDGMSRPPFFSEMRTDERAEHLSLDRSGHPLTKPVRSARPRVDARATLLQETQRAEIERVFDGGVRVIRREYSATAAELRSLIGRGSRSGSLGPMSPERSP